MYNTDILEYYIQHGGFIDVIKFILQTHLMTLACVLVRECVLRAVAEFGEIWEARVLDHRGRATHHDQHVIGWRRKVSFQH